MNFPSRHGLVLVVVIAAGCSSSTTGAGASSSSSGLPGSTTSGPTTCVDFGGACSKLGVASECAAGTARVEDASLCPSTAPDCCLAPPSAGTVRRVNDSGLVCTTAGEFPALAGVCGGQACQLGCECAVSGGAAVCDCTRGLPPASKGHEVCGVFACGVITCSVGCRCADAAQSACTCP